METAKAEKVPFYRVLYVQVLIAIVIGGVIGWLNPELGIKLQPLGDAFIKLIRMLIAPIIFCTVVSGIAGIQNAKKVGRVGGKAILYFEVVSTIALAIGLLIGNVVQPGAGFPSAGADATKVAEFAHRAEAQSTVQFLMNIIPDTIIGAFAVGDILQVLLFSVLFGFSLMALGEKGKFIRMLVEEGSHAIFGVVKIVMKLAPLGALGAMAFTIGRFGPSALGNLFNLIALFYITAAIFIFGVLGLVGQFVGFNIFKLVRYISAELLIVLGTSSSESALPPLMEKLERLGCPKSVVGLVVPTGYSFNLDGTNIYMTLSSLFIAQALGIHLGFGEQLTLLAVAMLTSKGASGVTGSGFVVLAGTLAAVSPALVPGMALIFGIDKFMSECRALTNIVGNAVATVVVSAWEGELDRTRMAAALDGKLAFDSALDDPIIGQPGAAE